METLQIKKENALAAFESADEKGKELLLNLFGYPALSLKITDRIKTFEDACKVLGIEQGTFKIGVIENSPMDDAFESIQAYTKLIIIAKALNEGWTPDWSDSDEYKYVPWFKEKSGFGLAYFDCGRWVTYTAVGSRLCFKTKDLAIYAATQFADIYNDFLTIK